MTRHLTKEIGLTRKEEIADWREKKDELVRKRQLTRGNRRTN